MTTAQTSSDAQSPLDAASGGIWAWLVETLPDALVCTDRRGDVTYWSPGAATLFGWTPKQAVRRSLTSLWAEGQEARRLREHLAAVGAGAPLEWTAAYRRDDGTIVWVSVQAQPLAGPDGFVGISLLARDISAQRNAELELERLSWQDTLTGLPNRQALQLRLADLAEQRHPRAALAVLDLDHFNLVNEAHGHDAGDRLLDLVASRLRTALGPDAFLARLGGDEFAVVLPDPGRAVETVEQLLATVGQPAEVGGAPLLISASAGVVLCPPTRVADALRHADASMYEAKRLGRGRVHVFDATAVARADSMLRLSTDMRRALQDDGDEFAVHYQPIVDLGTGELVALEALARWHHRELGAISPGRFVDVAEHTGLGARLDMWTMRRAFSDYAALVTSGVIDAKTRISVNVAASHLQTADVADASLRAAYDAGISPNQLMLEVTENALLHDPETTARVLRRLREQGVLIAVDDFGTAGSSLASLRQLPLDVLKIDRAFVRNVDAEGSDLAIVAALIDLAHALGVTVIAEGVETPEQRRRLAELGCEQAQGYLWTAPVPCDELEDALHDVVRRHGVTAAVSGLRPRDVADLSAVIGRQHGLLRMLELQREGNSIATISAALNAEGFRTPEGQRWHHTTVTKALAATNHR